MLVKGADATGYYFQSSFQLVAVEIDEVANVGEVIGRNGSEELTVIVIFVIAVDGGAVQPGEVIDYFQNWVFCLVDLEEEFGHGAGGVYWVLETSIEDVEECVRSGCDIGESPLGSCIELDFDAFVVLLVDVIEVGLSVVVVDVGDGGVLALVGAGQIHLTVDGRLHLHFL